MDATNLQGQTKDPGGDEKKGRYFLMIPIEMLEFLINRKNIELTGRHWSIIGAVWRELQGWGDNEKAITQKTMEELTGIHHGDLVISLRQLVDGKILTKKKIKGQRSAIYTFNRETFSRVLATDEPQQVTWKGSNILPFVKGSKPLPVTSSNVLPMNSSKLLPRESRKLPKLKRNLAPIYKIDKIDTLSHAEIQKFLATQARAIRSRWERYISEILLKNPEDCSLLLYAIEYVHKERKDFLDAPIKRSIIGLFESTEWASIKIVLLAKMKREKEKIEIQKTVDESRRQLHEQVEQRKPKEDEMSPYWREFMQRHSK
jgi:DNA-binding transcriptional regulator GbsR (MarR family)